MRVSEFVKISKLKTNEGQVKGLPRNPRFISNERFDNNVKSLLTFPKMLSKRKIILSSKEEPISLGGNMRLHSIMHIIYLSNDEFEQFCDHYNVSDQNKVIWSEIRAKEAIPSDWIDHTDGWTLDEKREFIIKDNVSFGSYDWSVLQEAWDIEETKDWGLEYPDWIDAKDSNYSSSEVDVDGLSDKMVIKLEYTEDEYRTVKEQLEKIADTPEQAVWKLLGNGEEY